MRDRVKELRRVKAGSLLPNPRNWRVHPTAQQEALRGALAEIGFAAALLVRELPDGSLEIIDGHLRAETAADAIVPVLVLDLDEAEANQLLATFDPLSAMAETDTPALASLLDEMEFDNEPLREMLDKLADWKPPSVREIPKLFQVIVECRDETEQETLYERLKGEGLKCKLQML